MPPLSRSVGRIEDDADLQINHCHGRHRRTGLVPRENSVRRNQVRDHSAHGFDASVPERQEPGWVLGFDRSLLRIHYVVWGGMGGVFDTVRKMK